MGGSHQVWGVGHQMWGVSHQVWGRCISSIIISSQIRQGKEDDPELNDNCKFYANEIPSCPDGDFIVAIHNDWMGQYSKLEYHHGYIQWYVPR